VVGTAEGAVTMLERTVQGTRSRKGSLYREATRLVSGVRNVLTKSGDLSEDFMRGCGADEWLWIRVMGLQVVMNSAFEFPYASERPAPYPARGNLGRGSLHQVEPRSPRGREVNAPMGTTGKPIPDLRCLVGAVVVHEPVHVQPLRHNGLNGLEEVEKLLMAVLPVTSPDHFACGDVQRSEQRGGSVADIVMAPAFGIARRHRQQRLRSVQGLNLRFLIDAQDRRFVWRRHIQTHDIPHLLDEQRVFGELEGLPHMGLPVLIARRPLWPPHIYRLQRRTR